MNLKTGLYMEFGNLSFWC